MPYDFFYSMNAGAGKNLDWFWKRWFFEDGVTDIAIKHVTKTKDGYNVAIENKSNKPLPVDLIFTYEDGPTSKQHYTIGICDKEKDCLQLKLKQLISLLK